MKHRRAGDHLDGGDVAGGIDQRVNLDIAGNALRLGQRRINRRSGLKELGGLHVTANREGRGGCLAMSGTDNGKRIRTSGRRISFNGGQGLGVFLEVRAVIDDRRSKVDIAENGFLRRLNRRCFSGSRIRIFWHENRGGGWVSWN